MLSDPGIITVDAQYQIEFNDLLSCVYQIIRFKGLPDTIDETYLKMCLYLGGRVAIFRDTRGDGAIRALDCAMAGIPDIYYMPSQIMIVNPAFKGYSYQLTPGEDVAVIFCREVDRYQYGRETGGLYGLISTTAQLLADNTESINVATKNMRLTNILSANDQMTVKSIDIVIKKMYSGEPYTCVQSSLIDQLNSIPMTAQTNTQQLIQLLQTRQYIYAHFYEQIGLKTHDQIKKERLITSEIDEGTELAVFNVEDMIAEIQRGVDDANRIFDLNIEIELHPLIAGTLDNPAEADPDAAPAEMAAEDQSDGDPDDDQSDAEPAEDQSDDAADDDQSDDAEPDEDQSDGDPDDDQSEDAADDDQSDAEPAEDQTDDVADDDQSDDAEQDEDQTDDAADDDQSDAEPAEINIEISGDVGGDINIEIGAEPADPEPDPDPEEDVEGGDDTDGD